MMRRLPRNGEDDQSSSRNTMLPGSADSIMARDFRLTPAARRRSPPPWKPFSTAQPMPIRVGAGGGHDVAQTPHGFTVGHEVVNDEDLIAQRRATPCSPAG